MKTYLLLCLLLVAASVHGQAPKPGLKPAKVCLSVEQASIIFSSLKSYERFKPVYVETRKANLAWRVTHEQDSVVIISQEKLLGWYQSNYAEEQQLRQDSDKKVVMWRRKARKRGWIIGLGIGLPAAYALYQLVK